MQADSMYRGTADFTREQIIFVAECMLVGALDMIESGLPTSIDVNDRKEQLNRIDGDPFALSPYERGALEAAGEALSILYAQITGDGMGCYDALAVAENFNEHVEAMMRSAWLDEGHEVKAAVRRRSGRYRHAEVIPNYPDCRKHAAKFVEAFDDYLAEAESPFSDVGVELDDGDAVCFPNDNGDIRRIDSNGNTEEVRGIGDPDWNEWRDLFLDDALYFQPDEAGDPDCGTSAATINSFDVYRNRENAEQAHPDCDILGFTFADIEKPVFLDVENPTYHDKSNDPKTDVE